MTPRLLAGALGVLTALGCGGLGSSLDATFEEIEAGLEAAEADPASEEAVPPAPEPVPADVTLSEADLIVVPGKSDTVIVQYSDWRCPHCMRAYPAVRAMAEGSGAELRFRNFPLSGPCNPMVEDVREDRCQLGLASICAHRAGRFDAWFNEADRSPEGALEAFSGDEAFLSCLEDPAVAEQLDAQIESGVALELQGTPTFYVRREGGWALEDLDALLR